MRLVVHAVGRLRQEVGAAVAILRRRAPLDQQEHAGRRTLGVAHDVVDVARRPVHEAVRDAEVVRHHHARANAQVEHVAEPRAVPVDAGHGCRAVNGLERHRHGVPIDRGLELERVELVTHRPRGQELIG